MTLEQWLQSWLIAHGYPVGPVGGAFGVKSRAALVDFQCANGLKPSGMADAPTVAALKANPAGETRPVAPAPAERMSP